MHDTCTCSHPTTSKRVEHFQRHHLEHVHNPSAKRYGATKRCPKSYLGLPGGIWFC